MRGIVLREGDDHIRRNAKRMGLSVEVREELITPFDKTLFFTSGVKLPWDLLSVGYEFLEKWECAAPVWRYDTLAVDLATGEERERTQALLRDLRVPLYAHELLFVKDSPGGNALLEAWQEELALFEGRGEPRLAFVRALYRVKPLFLALPRSWLGQDRATRHITTIPRPQARQERANRFEAAPMVKVQIAPGRFVKCKPGEEETVKAEWARRGMTRRERRLARGK